tara:strand:+ start:85045 stop:85491 length:447 start_codon:yes stop_codon:yes gene_type:complete
MTTTWILVADRSTATLFAKGKRWDQLTLIEALDNPDGRAHEGDLVTDQGGAVFQSAGQGQRRSTEPQVSATEHAANLFAGTLAEQLRKARVDNQLEELVIVAAPDFLGRIRAKLDASTANLITHEIDKHYTQKDSDELGRALQQRLGL